MDGMLYYDDHYLQSQNYNNLVDIKLNGLSAFFEINQETATSLSKAPFGGIRVAHQSSLNELKSYLETCNQQLKNLGVKKIIVKQPPIYYSGFVSSDMLIQSGFTIEKREINQYVKLKSPKLHPMQQRILKKQKDIEIRKGTDTGIAHDFIAKCRISQNLRINIPIAQFVSLTEKMQDKYEIFTAHFESELVATVVLTYPQKGIAYYYLPATHPDYRALSPMVYLMNYLYAELPKKEISHLDMGRSSIDGKPQEGLFNFKKRMGAHQTESLELTKIID